MYEHEERPKALAALKSALNQTTVFLATVKNMTDVEDPIFTQVELETLEKLINETKVGLMYFIGLTGISIGYTCTF